MESSDLSVEIKKLNKHLARVYRQQSLGMTFLRGILSGLGSVIGATLVVGIIAFMLRNVNVVPIIGDWLGEVFAYIFDNLSDH